MQSSFKLEVKLMYREFMKIIYKKDPSKRAELLQRTRDEFKAGAKIPRKDIIAVDFAFNQANRQLYQLRQGNILSMTTYVPKSNRK